MIIYVDLATNIAAWMFALIDDVPRFRATQVMNTEFWSMPALYLLTITDQV